MPELPKMITVDMEGRKVLLDGVEFPWYIAEDGVSITGLGSKTELPRVTLTLIADALEVLPMARPRYEELPEARRLDAGVEWGTGESTRPPGLPPVTIEEFEKLWEADIPPAVQPK